MLQEGSLPRIVYIAGYGRSGSTLLDVFLNHHPLMVGVGELSSLFLEWQAGDPCSCGEGVDRCDFWTRVMAQIDLPPAEAERITRPVEASSLRPAAWNNGGGEYDAYVQLWQAVMTAIGQESGKPIVVDSSKNSRPAARRISALRKLGGFDVRVVHLVRDPRAAMWSALRGRNKLMEAGQHKSGRADAYKALLATPTRPWSAGVSPTRGCTWRRSRTGTCRCCRCATKTWCASRRKSWKNWAAFWTWTWRR